MRSTFKVLFYVNGSKEKDGMVPIMGRITIYIEFYNYERPHQSIGEVLPARSYGLIA